MGKINATWHRAHPMPKNPTVDQWIEWHLAHANARGCRAIHGKILEEIKRRGIKVPPAPLPADPAQRSQSVLSGWESPAFTPPHYLCPAQRPCSRAI
jgi:hypothetical protein